MIEWRHVLLDSEDQPLGNLDGVTDGDGEIVAQSRLGGSGSLTIDERGQGIDWMSHRVQTWYHPEVGEPWPFGTWLFASPREQHHAFGVTYNVTLLSKMNVVDADTVEDRFSVDPGRAVIPTVVTLLQSTGETRMAVTDSDAVLTAGMTWDAGTSKLSIINDLLAAIGYWSLWCDGSGLFRVEPYVRPQDRPVLREFTYGEESLYLPGWSREQDNTSVPNRFVAVGKSDEDTEPLVGVATNENPDSPYSYQARGRWITATDEGVEAVSQQVIDAYAARRLLDGMSPVARMDVSHAVLDLPPDGLIAFTPKDGVRRLATIQRMKVDFRFDTLIDAEWRQVL